MKKLTALLLSAVLIISMFTAYALSASAATATISYSYSGKDSAKPGFAEGTITLTGQAGTYWLYWADNSNVLTGYTQLAKLTLSSQGSVTHKMYERSAIPADAKKLVAYKSTSKPSVTTVAAADAVYDIPASKRLAKPTSQRLYRFASYSDVHIDDTYKTYKYCQEHWNDALNTAAARGAEFITLSGDYVNNNIDYSGISVAEWKTYQKVLANSNYCDPVYEAIGNHELWQDPAGGTKDFIKATGLEGSNGTASKAYFEKTLNGDHFIFMAMEGGFYPDRTEEFTDAQLTWVENLVKKYSGDGHNIYIIEHSQFYKYGAGDRTNGEPYYDIPLKDNQVTSRRFKALLNNYKDIIFLSGHTHIAFKEQYNFSDNNGTSCQMVHNSSVGGTRPIVNGTLDRAYPRDQTEGYIVDVFGDAIIFNGANLYYNEYDPNCCYIIKTSSTMYAEQHGGTSPTASPVTSPTSPSETGNTVAPTTPATDSTIALPTVSPSSYYLKGSFNSWGNSNPLYSTNDAGIYLTTLRLSAGTYTFKINSGSTWYGNAGTIEDTTKKTSKGGWELTTSAGDCTLKATGGYYTFNFNSSNHKLNVYYTEDDPYATEAPQPTTQPTTAQPTTAPEPSYSLGDVDGDGIITVMDATMIQRSLVSLETLTQVQYNAADVDVDGYVTVQDATKIQRYIVGLDTLGRASVGSKNIVSSGASDIKTTVKENLAKYYRYSSYDCYQALKKEYKKTSPDESKLETLQSALLAVVDPSNVDASGNITVYFENTNGWSSPNAYAWGSGNEKAWPGNAMTYVGRNSNGKSIYKYTVNIDKYQKIIFNSGSNQTQDITLSDSNTCYYISGSSSPYSVGSYTFKQSYIVG